MTAWKPAKFMLLACAVLVLVSPGGARAVDVAGGKPNILLFLGDDHSTFDTGCYGNAVVRTPRIDQLAQEGMRFDRAFTSTAMCAPSRSMLYTGLFPHRNGCHMNHGASRKGVKSLPHYLRAQGYRVVLAGKTHIKPREVYPFEYIGFADVDKVIRGDQPFCLIMASHEPHAPHAQGGFTPQDVPLPPYMVDTPATRRERAGYYTDIARMDDEIAQVERVLKNSGKKDNTLFLYAADHGAGLMAKWTCYEAGLRVPFVARWPGRIAPGTTTDAMVQFVDVLPTFIELAGGRVPDNLDGKSFLDVLLGKAATHRKLVFGAHSNQGIISGEPYPIRSVRDERYKYIRNLMPQGRPTSVATHGMNYKEQEAGSWAEWKERARTDAGAAALARRVLERPAEELYDLLADPWELKNVADDPAMAAMKTRLSGELDSWMKQQGDRGVKDELAVPRYKSRGGQGADNGD